jgi:hypothetical protein
MKFYQIILILFLLSVVQANECTSVSPSKKKDCNEKSKSSESDGWKYCCYEETNGAKSCDTYDQAEYDAIGKWPDATKKAYKEAKIKIECESSYIAFTLLSLILVIL